MLATLQRKLFMDQPEFDLFLQELNQKQARIAGSFPLVWAVKPRPTEWHPRTRTEVITCALVSKRLGVLLPMPALKKIGNWLQLSELIQDMKNNQMEILIVHPHRFKINLDWEAVPYSLNGIFATHSKILKTRSFQRNSSKVTFIAVSGTVENFFRRFESSFFQASLGCSMRGKAKIASFQSCFNYLDNCYQWAVEHNAILDGITALQWKSCVPKLAKDILKQWEEYDRRRFTITNFEKLSKFVN